jgi:hypothetical protein
MAFQPATNIAQCQLMGVVDNQLTVNDLYFEISGGGINFTNLSAITAAVASWFSGTLAPLLSDDWSAVRVIGTDLTTAVGPRREISSPAPGGVSGEANPNNVAMCVSFRTELRGRSARGRNFVPGIPGSVVTLNTLDPTFISDVTTAYFALAGPGTFLAGWQWVVLSRETAGVLRPDGIGFPITDVVSVTNSVRSMRSREVGHGA